ncbi:K(+)-INSENSITIVE PYROPHOSPHATE-ENERGIZED PROTON PUMP [Salix purpurea]|uniref:H(+)-exporting diphosphatase n=1 Tax=Salix purpurea TaxID=77065 RepID=A0A9Q0W8D6_SALPP|nr:K(+)-INSENSITIVE PYROPHOSPHATE-ENERGIZED PROTON PUMP [Salix purpurea]
MGMLSEGLTQVLIPAAALVGIAFALLQWYLVSKVKVSGDSSGDYSDKLIEEEEEGTDNLEVSIKCAEIQNAISVGATSFLLTQYKYLIVFMGVFAAIIFVFLGFLGMKIATYANARTTLEARKGVGKAFITAFRSGAVMGFLLAANGLLVLYISIILFKTYYGDDWEGLYESITGYGLGGSSMALFGRVGGGIYTKAADVGADLVGKVERNIPEDDPRNPAVIADNVGDNVGDIAGMGSDLFGSYAEASCAALFVASISSIGINHDYTAMSYPLIISSVGIVVCLITTLLATDLSEIRDVSEIEPSLKRQLVVSTILMTVGIAVVSFFGFAIRIHSLQFRNREGCQELAPFSSVLPLIVAYSLLESRLSGNAKPLYNSLPTPVQDVADSCRTGAATNVIFGFSLAAMYGIAVAALGMLSTIATGLAIDAYGPISDNAGGIAEMAGMSHKDS